MLSYPAAVNALYLNFKQDWQEAFTRTKTRWQMVAQRVPSSTDTEVHFWMDRIPQLRQWVGERIVQNVALRSYSLKNLPFEHTIGLDRFKVEDNRMNAFSGVVQAIAEKAKKWPDSLMFNSATGALPNGQNVITYDGQPFFSTAHPNNLDDPDSASQSNYQASGFPLNSANFGTALQAMRAYIGADGFPLEVNPSLLIVPPQMETTAIQILKEEWIAPGPATFLGAAGVLQPNPFRGVVDYVVIPELAGQPTTWYLIDNTSAIKPFIFQDRMAPEFVQKTKPDDENVVMRHELLYLTTARGAGGYGPWFMAYKASA